MNYELPAFLRNVSDDFDYLEEGNNNNLSLVEYDVVFSDEQIREIFRLFSECNIDYDLEHMLFISGIYLRQIFKLHNLSSQYFINTKRIVQFIKEQFPLYRIKGSCPSNFIIYGLHPNELNCVKEFILDNIYLSNGDYEGLSLFFETYDYNISHSPYEKFQEVSKTHINLLEIEILLTKEFAMNKRMVELIRREIDYLNQHKKCAMKMLGGEQQYLIMEGVKNAKENVGKLVEKYIIDLPEDLHAEIFRFEKIFTILVAEEIIGDNFSPSVGEVLQNKDLNRYLMEFI